jgi:hypothetical protein
MSFDAPYWNALQVLAWVGLGNRALVAGCGNETNSAREGFWKEQRVPSEDGGIDRILDWTPSRAPTELMLQLYAAESGRSHKGYDAIGAAEQEILGKLVAGALSVTGRQKGHPRPTRQEISALEWQDLTIEYDKNSAVDKDKFSGREAYDILSFNREAVLKLWPKPRTEREQAVGENPQPPTDAASIPTAVGDEGPDNDVPAHQPDEANNPKPILKKEKRRNEFLAWAKGEYGQDLANLPNRDKLLGLGRDNVASNVNQSDARWLRQHAPQEARRGGRRRKA